MTDEPMKPLPVACSLGPAALAAQPDEGPITLDLTGPEGTREFLDGVLNPDA